MIDNHSAQQNLIANLAQSLAEAELRAEILGMTRAMIAATEVVGRAREQPASAIRTHAGLLYAAAEKLDTLPF